MIKQTISFGDTFNSAFVTWKKHFIKIAIVAIVVYTPAQILIEIASVLFQNIFPADDISNVRLMNNIYNLIRQLIGSIAVLGIINFVYLQLSESDKTLSSYDIIVHGLKKWPDFMLASIVAGFKILLYLLLLIIPGIYKGVRLSFLDCIIATKDKSIDDSCNDSEFIVENNWWRIFGFIVLLLLIEFFNELVFVIPLFSFAESHVASVLLGVLIKIFTSFLVVVRATYYFKIERFSNHEASQNALEVRYAEQQLP
jgi:hypothetical protein